MSDDAVILHRLKLRAEGRLALRGEGWDQFQWADDLLTGHHRAPESIARPADVPRDRPG